MKHITLTILLIMLTGCPAPQDHLDGPSQTIHIEIEDHWTNTATLKMWVAHSTEPWSFLLQLNDSTILEGTVEGSDTTITEYGLSEATEYSFNAFMLSDGEVMDTSDTLHMITKLQTEFLGLEGHWATQMKLSGDLLYTGSWEIGLNRLDISNDSSSWVYLGLSNNELSSSYRISDILVNENDSREILVAGGASWTPQLFKSVDGGISWDLSGEYGQNHPKIDKFQTTNGKVIGWGEGRQYFSYDFGDTWISYEVPYPPVPFLDGVDAFEKCSFNDDYLWFTGHNFYGPELFRSQDGGAGWDRVARLEEYPFGSVASIAPHPRNRNIVYIVLGGNLYKCIDGGDDWVVNGIDYSETLIDSARTVLIDPVYSDRMFISRYNKLFTSNDAGWNWERMNVNLPAERYIYTMVFDPEGSRLYLGTTSGVYLVRVNKQAQF